MNFSENEKKKPNGETTLLFTDTLVRNVNAKKMSLYPIRKNKILAKISENQVYITLKQDPKSVIPQQIN